MKAVFSACGRQFRAREGDVLLLDFMEVESGQILEFSDIMFMEHGDDVHVGRPTLDNAKVVVRVLGMAKGDKIRVYKHRRRKHHRKTMGHRQKYIQVKVEKITLN